MKLVAAAAFDTAVNAYMPPQYFRTIGEAERAFVNTVSKEGHQFNANAKDYSFVLLGDFDDNSGVFTNANPPRTIITATQALGLLQNKDNFMEVRKDGIG